MLNGTNGIVKIVLSILFFPMFFQTAFITFAWGADDPMWIMIGRRMFVLLPVMAIILGPWPSIACLLPVFIRQKRREFIMALFITWWDLGKAIVYFWGGIFRFIISFFAAIVA